MKWRKMKYERRGSSSQLNLESSYTCQFTCWISKDIHKLWAFWNFDSHLATFLKGSLTWCLNLLLSSLTLHRKIWPEFNSLLPRQSEYLADQSTGCEAFSLYQGVTVNSNLDIFLKKVQTCHMANSHHHQYYHTRSLAALWAPTSS